MEFRENTENQRWAGSDEISHLQPAKGFQSKTEARGQRSDPGSDLGVGGGDRTINEGCRREVRLVIKISERITGAPSRSSRRTRIPRNLQGFNGRRF